MINTWIAALALVPAGQATPSDVKLESLSDGFVRVKSSVYSVEVPKAWTVGSQTPWGARSITPAKSSQTELGVMTAGVTHQSWDELYKTSMFFIMRQEKGKATPYRLGKTKSGYESCSFEVANEEGFVKRKYVLLKNAKGAAIALSVIIGDQKQDKEVSANFARMVSSAKIVD